MQSNYLDATEEEKQNIINDYLSYKLPPELKERYQKRKQEAIDLQEQNYQSPSDFDSLKEQNSFRNLQAGLQKAANQFGTNPLDGKVSSSYNIDDEMAQANKIDASAFDYKAKQYAQAMDQERQADSDLLKIDDYNMGLVDKANQTNRQAQADSWAQEQQGRTRKDWDIKDAEEASNAQKSDPNSPVSKSYQNLMSKVLGGTRDLSGYSAAQIISVMPSLVDVYKADRKGETELKVVREKTLGSLAVENSKNINKTTKNGDPNKPETHPLYVPGIGIAKNSDDAKKLKDATVAKHSLESKIKEMIELREKHGGGTIINREDVARAQQLSKDALLSYKNMAKLGVLSKSDEDIVNAIIPSDPLKYNSPLAAIQGQDPILSNLKKFLGDINEDFDNTVSLRVEQQSKVPGEKTQSTVNDDPFAAWERK